MTDLALLVTEIFRLMACGAPCLPVVSGPASVRSGGIEESVAPSETVSYSRHPNQEVQAQFSSNKSNPRYDFCWALSVAKVSFRTVVVGLGSFALIFSTYSSRVEFLSLVTMRHHCSMSLLVEP